MDTVGLPLKMFVIGAGVLLVVGTIALVVLVVLRLGGEPPGGGDPAGPSAASTGEPLPLPPGARIEQIVPDPAGGPVVLFGTDHQDAPFLAVVDLEQGTLVRLIRFQPEAVP